MNIRGYTPKGNLKLTEATHPSFLARAFHPSHKIHGCQCKSCPWTLWLWPFGSYLCSWRALPGHWFCDPQMKTSVQVHPVMEREIEITENSNTKASSTIPIYYTGFKYNMVKTPKSFFFFFGGGARNILYSTNINICVVLPRHRTISSNTLRPYNY